MQGMPAKKMVLLLLFVFAADTLGALPQLGVLTGGIGLGFSDRQESNLEFDVNFLYVSYEFDGYYEDFTLFGLGIGWIPGNYKYIAGNHYWSFFNYQLFWNVFALVPEKAPSELSRRDLFVGDALCGPFAFVNYAPNFEWDRCMVTYGIRYQWTGNIENNRLYFFNVESGFRNIKNKNHFYFNVGIDIVFTSFLSVLKIAGRNKD